MNANVLLKKLMNSKGISLNVDSIRLLFRDYVEDGKNVDDLIIRKTKYYYLVQIDAADSYVFRLYFGDSDILINATIQYSPYTDIERNEETCLKLIENNLIGSIAELMQYYIIQYGSLTRHELEYILKNWYK